MSDFQIGQWVLYEDGHWITLGQLSNVGFIAEVATVREFADGSQAIEFHPVAYSRLIPVDPEQLVWENGRPLLPRAELDRRQQAADAAKAKQARDLELARKPGTKFEIVMGGSGRWVARRITADLGNGKYSVAPPAFTGHVPVRKLGPNVSPSSIVLRQLRRKIAAGEVAQWHEGPRGGSSFVLTP